jgi:hypothetical protein
MLPKKKKKIWLGTEYMKNLSRSTYGRFPEISLVTLPVKF